MRFILAIPALATSLYINFKGFASAILAHFNAFSAISTSDSAAGCTRGAPDGGHAREPLNDLGNPLQGPQLVGVAIRFGWLCRAAGRTRVAGSRFCRRCHQGPANPARAKGKG